MIRYNRAVALQQSHQWEKAAEDFTHALQLGADNEEDILARTAACHPALSEQDG